MAQKSPSLSQCARALWLLGLDWPESIDEISAAWRRRVASAHPDRHSERSTAATRLTAAFNEAREICEWWLAEGHEWPKPRPPEQLRDSAEQDVEAKRGESRAKPERREPFRPGDLVAPAELGSDAAAVQVLAVADGVARLSDGASAPLRGLTPVSFGCPVCGICVGPVADRPRLRPCLDCLFELTRLERDERAVDEVMSAYTRRAVKGRETASALGNHGLEELARERATWVAGVARRPREERRGKLLAAYAHAYALWAAGHTAEL